VYGALTAATAAPFFAAGCVIIPPGGWNIDSPLAAESSKTIVEFC
jgi:hypothetical protein